MRKSYRQNKNSSLYNFINVIYYQHDSDGIYQSGELDQTGLDLLSVLKIARHLELLKRAPMQEDSEWQNIAADLGDYLNLDENELEDLMELN